MAFPYLFEENFELGTKGGFDTETDTGSLLDFPHYTDLVKAGSPPPFRGAYCMRIRPGDTNDHTLTEGDIDIADAASAYTRFYLHVSNDFTGTADDTFNLYELQQAGGTVEVSLGMRITATSNLLEIGIGDGTAPTSFVPFTRGRWTCVELLATISTGGSGIVTLFLDGGQVATLTSQTHAAAIGQGVIGTRNTLSTTTGTLLFDQFAVDDARLYPISNRFPDEVVLTKSGHVFLGMGVVDNVSLLSGAAADNVLSLYDTDNAGVNDATNIKAELKNTTASELVDPAGMPATFQRGCYVAMSGTNPRAIVKIRAAQAYGSSGRIQQHAMSRNPAPGGW